ncbi:MAG: tetratricopeptide repeat protein [Deltaproteobacteria bacterium]|nr:tetratricopeptide repeat protein [Deltaproteobacteria bacterium]
MSLIHKALQKSRGEDGKTGEGERFLKNQFLAEKQDGNFPSSRKSVLHPRVVLLVTLLLLSLTLVGALRFFKGSSLFQPRIPSPVVAPFGGGSPGELASLAEAKFAEGDFEAGLRAWKTALLKEENPEFYNNIGLSYKKKGDLDLALENYNKALSIKPDFAECLNNLGVLWTAKKDPATAARFLQKAIQAEPGYADPYLNLAIVQEKSGHYQEARLNYRKFLELASNIPKELREKVRKKMEREGL